MRLTSRMAFALLLFTAPVGAQVDPTQEVLPDKPASHCTLISSTLCDAVHDQAIVIPSGPRQEFAGAAGRVGRGVST